MRVWGGESVAGVWACGRLLDGLQVAVESEEVPQEVPDARAWAVGAEWALAHADPKPCAPGGRDRINGPGQRAVALPRRHTKPWCRALAHEEGARGVRHLRRQDEHRPVPVERVPAVLRLATDPNHEAADHDNTEEQCAPRELSRLAEALVDGGEHWC